MLQIAMRLPWPANRLAFASLGRAFRVYGRSKATLTRIRFGNIEIEVPLEHPAVYWRYRPPGFNMNYVRLVKTVIAVKFGTIIDVGANVGDGVALLRANGVNSRILAVEGVDEYAALLRKNSRSFIDVEISCVFLGTGGDEGGFAVDRRKGSAKLVAGLSAIKISSLDALLHRLTCGDIAVLKIDTDGFDAKVLRGAKNTLDNRGPVVFAELDEALLRQQGDSSEDLLALLTESGYAYLAVWDNDANWLGSRAIERGIGDWVSTYPGGYGQRYLDVAAFKQADRAIFETVVRAEAERTSPGGLPLSYRL
jgi:FkbM family methyltransferase